MNLMEFRLWVAQNVPAIISHPSDFIVVPKEFIPTKFTSIINYFKLGDIEVCVCPFIENGAIAVSIGRRIMFEKSYIVTHDDAVLRFIFAHECAHIYNDDGVKKERAMKIAARVTIFTFIALFLSCAFGLKYLIPEATVIFYIVASFYMSIMCTWISTWIFSAGALAYIRSAEYEADRLASYAIGETDAGVRLFSYLKERYPQLEVNLIRRIWHSHPTNTQRIARLKSLPLHKYPST